MKVIWRGTVCDVLEVRQHHFVIAFRDEVKVVRSDACQQVPDGPVMQVGQGVQVGQSIGFRTDLRQTPETENPQTPGQNITSAGGHKTVESPQVPPWFSEIVDSLSALEHEGAKDFWAAQRGKSPEEVGRAMEEFYRPTPKSPFGRGAIVRFRNPEVFGYAKLRVTGVSGNLVTFVGETDPDHRGQAPAHRLEPWREEKELAWVADLRAAIAEAKVERVIIAVDQDGPCEKIFMVDLASLYGAIGKRRP